MRGCVKVAVCTNRTAAAIRESLGSLEREVPPDRVAVVASGVGEEQAQAITAEYPAAHLIRAPAGLSLARNRALEWCADDDMIAFVDDDAVIQSGWYAALERAWANAGERVACIGGPIRPRFESPVPGWLSEPLLPALTILDLGAAERELDPGETAVYGANISFRVRALREVGGFDPELGHRGARVYFGEEDAAQRELAARGWRVLYAPGVAVDHVIPAERLRRRSFVRRRFAYGVALGARGGRSLPVALRQAASSAVGCIPAAVRRDGRLFMERAVRAAENLGVVLSRVVRPR